MQGHVDAIGHVEEMRAGRRLPLADGQLPAAARAVHRSQGLDRRGRHQPDGRGPRRPIASTCMSCRLRWSTRTCGRDRLGDRVNLECDMVGKYVVRAAELAGLTLSSVRPGEVDTLTPGRNGRRRRAVRSQRRTQRRPFARIEDAVEAIRAGEMIIVVDDEDRENEGDLTIAAEKVTPEAINFMARYGRGLICLSMTPERLDELEIPLMVSQNTLALRHRRSACRSRRSGGRRTGISAADRAATVLAAIDPATRAGRSRAARPHVPAARADRRRAGARRADRGGGRSGADRRAVPGRRHLRNHERRRHDGARAAADEVREAARAADDHRSPI